jgi:hypothetical protein
METGDAVQGESERCRGHKHGLDGTVSLSFLIRKEG